MDCALTLVSLYYGKVHLDYGLIVHDFFQQFPMVLYQYWLHVRFVVDLRVKERLQLVLLHLKKWTEVKKSDSFIFKQKQNVWNWKTCCGLNVCQNEKNLFNEKKTLINITWSQRIAFHFFFYWIPKWKKKSVVIVPNSESIFS